MTRDITTNGSPEPPGMYLPLLPALFLISACVGEMGPVVLPREADGEWAVEPASSDETHNLSCGDERRPAAGEPQAVIHGSASWDPEVVELSEGQALAVGAIMYQQQSGWSNGCSGTLIAPRVVLTAAHCLIEPIWLGAGVYDPREIRFAVGDNAAAPVETFAVESVIPHPRFPRLSFGGDATFDVGLLLLSEDATERLPGLRPIPVNCEPLNADRLEGQRIQVGGFGLTRHPSLEYDVPHNWQRNWAVLEVVHLSRNDVVLTGQGSTYTCKGDSGSGALWSMVDGQVRVIGTDSWGSGDCSGPTHFSRLDGLCDFIVPHLGPCGLVAVEGECIDDRAVFCEDNRLQEMDCAARGELCGETDSGLMRCMPTPCGDETPQGRCDGETAVFCDDDRVWELDCADQGMYCARDTDGYVHCADDCAGLDWTGRCEGETALWCDSGRVRERRCADCGQECGWNGELNAVDCI